MNILSGYATVPSPFIEKVISYQFPFGLPWHLGDKSMDYSFVGVCPNSCLASISLSPFNKLLNILGGKDHFIF